MSASIVGRITGAALIVAISIGGVIYDAAHATDLDHSISVQLPTLLSGTAGSPTASTVIFDNLSGVEIIVMPQDTRGHARSFLPPRREAKGVPHRNAPRRDA